MKHIIIVQLFTLLFTLFTIYTIHYVQGGAKVGHCKSHGHCNPALQYLHVSILKIAL